MERKHEFASRAFTIPTMVSIKKIKNEKEKKIVFVLKNIYDEIYDIN